MPAIRFLAVALTPVVASSLSHAAPIALEFYTFARERDGIVAVAGRYLIFVCVWLLICPRGGRFGECFWN